MSVPNRVCLRSKYTNIRVSPSAVRTRTTAGNRVSVPSALPETRTRFTRPPPPAPGAADRPAQHAPWARTRSAWRHCGLALRGAVFAGRRFAVRGRPRASMPHVAGRATRTRDGAPMVRQRNMQATRRFVIRGPRDRVAGGAPVRRTWVLFASRAPGIALRAIVALGTRASVTGSAPVWRTRPVARRARGVNEPLTAPSVPDGRALRGPCARNRCACPSPRFGGGGQREDRRARRNPLRKEPLWLPSAAPDTHRFAAVPGRATSTRIACPGCRWRPDGRINLIAFDRGKPLPTKRTSIVPGSPEREGSTSPSPESGSTFTYYSPWKVPKSMPRRSPT